MNQSGLITLPFPNCCSACGGNGKHNKLVLTLNVAARNLVTLCTCTNKITGVISTLYTSYNLIRCRIFLTNNLLLQWTAHKESVRQQLQSKSKREYSYILRHFLNHTLDKYVIARSLKTCYQGPCVCFNCCLFVYICLWILFNYQKGCVMGKRWSVAGALQDRIEQNQSRREKKYRKLKPIDNGSCVNWIGNILNWNQLFPVKFCYWNTAFHVSSIVKLEFIQTKHLEVKIIATFAVKSSICGWRRKH